MFSTMFFTFARFDETMMEKKPPAKCGIVVRGVVDKRRVGFWMAHKHKTLGAHLKELIDIPVYGRTIKELSYATP
jgi:hypothetical protein